MSGAVTQETRPVHKYAAMSIASDYMHRVRQNAAPICLAVVVLILLLLIVHMAVVGKCKEGAGASGYAGDQVIVNPPENYAARPLENYKDGDNLAQAIQNENLDSLMKDLGCGKGDKWKPSVSDEPWTWLRKASDESDDIVAYGYKPVDERERAVVAAEEPFKNDFEPTRAMAGY